MKPIYKLRKKYGKLTTLGERTISGRRYARVRCSCGREKDVLASSLLHGRTKSCGIGPCKLYARTKVDPNFRPYYPRACTPATIRAMWDAYHRPDPKRRKTAKQLSERYDLAVNTIRAIFRTVRRAGGIERYLKLIEE